MTEPETFTVTLRALPGVDGHRALRRLLKFAFRYCDMRAVAIAESPPLRQAAPSPKKPAETAASKPA